MEQLEWQVPDHVIVPGGNLGNSSALGKAFLELRELGFVQSLPKISIIQAEGANALVRTMHENGGKKLIPVQAETLATAIRIGPDRHTAGVRNCREGEGVNQGIFVPLHKF